MSKQLFKQLEHLHAHRNTNLKYNHLLNFLVNQKPMMFLKLVQSVLNNVERAQDTK